MEFTPYVAKRLTFGDLEFPFFIADEMGKMWYGSCDSQEMPERIWCRDHIKPGFNVVDCGAHHGLMTILFAKWVGPAGRVFAYEVVPENAEAIRRNVVLNGLENVVVRDVGFGDANGSMIATGPHASNPVMKLASETDEGAFQIVRLDDDIPSNVKIDFLKIDVEGSDFLALRGMPRILSTRPIINLECHNFHFENARDTVEGILQILKPSDYRFEVEGEVGSDFVGFDEIDPGWLLQFHDPHIYCIPK